MADFPQLEPAKRGWSMGVFPVSQQPAWGLRPIPFRHGLSPAGHPLQIPFELLIAAEAALIRAHFRGQRGTVIPFALPEIVWRGSGSLTGPVVAGTLWRYRSAPQETHRVGSLIDMTVELEALR